MSRPQHTFLAIVLALGASSASAQVPSPAETAASAPVAESGAVPSLSGDEEVEQQLAEFSSPGGLTAEQVAERAANTSHAVSSAQAAVVVTETARRRAWQGFFPNFEVSARYTRLSPVTQPDFGIGFSPEQQAGLDQAVRNLQDPAAQQLWGGLLESFSGDGFAFPVLLDNYAFRASLTYPVSAVIFQVLPQYRAGETAIEAQQLQVDARRRQVAMQARQAFFEFARARGGLSVAEKAVEQAQAHERQVRALVDAGSAARVDLLRVQARVAQAQVAVERARGGVNVGQRALRILMHAENSESIDVGHDFSQFPAAPDGDLDSLVAEAVAGRPEVVALEHLAQVRRHSIEAALGRRYPQLVLQGNIDIANPNQRIIPAQEEFRTTWDLSVILSWSPNELGAARQAVAEAEAQLEQVRADRQALEDSVRLEVSQSLEGYRTAAATFAATRASLHAAEESYRVRFEQLQAGSAVTADLIDADADLSRARLEMINAAIEVHHRHAQLLNAIGR